MKQAVWRDLGVREYAEVWELQKELLAERQAGRIPDTLVTVEHPHVITLGRKHTAQANVLRREMPVFEIERGGDVTYHGPGQLVGYPILQLGDGERDLHEYLRKLEEGLIRALADVGLDGGRREGWTGVWVGPRQARKVASIGIAVRKWVTMHGFALNVSTELARFGAINPCGLDAAVMTSVAAELGRPVGVAEVLPRVVARLGEALGRTFA